MPKKAYLANYYSSDELKQKYIKSQDAVEARRWHILWKVERLWTLVDEPLVNESFETIEEIEELLVKRCNVLAAMKETIKNLTNYHWLSFL